MEKNCLGITKNGQRCKRRPAPGSKYCLFHLGQQTKIDKQHKKRTISGNIIGIVGVVIVIVFWFFSNPGAALTFLSGKPLRLFTISTLASEFKYRDQSKTINVVLPGEPFTIRYDAVNLLNTSEIRVTNVFLTINKYQPIEQISELTLPQQHQGSGGGVLPIDLEIQLALEKFLYGYNRFSTPTSEIVGQKINAYLRDTGQPLSPMFIPISSNGIQPFNLSILLDGSGYYEFRIAVEYVYNGKTITQSIPGIFKVLYPYKYHIVEEDSAIGKISSSFIVDTTQNLVTSNNQTLPIPALRIPGEILFSSNMVHFARNALFSLDGNHNIKMLFSQSAILPKISPNLQEISYLNDPFRNLYILNINSLQALPISINGTTIDYSWSTNSDQILYDVLSPDSSYKLNLVSLKTGDINLLSFSSNIPLRRLNWSPTGDVVAMESGENDPRDLLIYKINGDSMSVKKLVGAFNYSLWSPDGRYLLFTTSEGARPPYEVLFAYDVDTQNILRITDAVQYPVGNNSNYKIADIYGIPFAWSPNGKQIVYAAFSDLWLKDFPGGLPRNITKNQESDNSPIWSPDGKYISFVGNDAQSKKIGVIDLSDGSQYELINCNNCSMQLLGWLRSSTP